MPSSTVKTDGERTPLSLDFSGSKHSSLQLPSSAPVGRVRQSSVRIDMLNGTDGPNKQSLNLTETPLTNGTPKNNLDSRENSGRSLGVSHSTTSYGSLRTGSDSSWRRRASMLMRLSVSEVEESITLTWRDIHVFAPAPRSFSQCCQKDTSNTPQPKEILKGVSGIAEPRHLLAILGASGAGKTTLLNVLTYRNRGNLDVQGEIKVNGGKIGRGMESMSGYVQQDDIFIGTLTVKEHLWFQSQLRMDKEIPQAVREKRVEAVMQQIGLEKCADTYIGLPGKLKGISGGEKKRLAVASEVLTNPPLMFLDEPTSGLDSFMARNIVNMLKTMAAQGRTIICTIHQPSSETFELFDRVLLVAEGRTAFLGPSKEALKFFNRCGSPCPMNYNPADHYIHTLAVVPTQEKKCRSRIEAICDAHDVSECNADVIEKIDRANQHEDFSEYEETAFAGQSPYKAGVLTQFRVLLWRSWLSGSREPGVFRTRFCQSTFLAFIFGLLYMPKSTEERKTYDADRVNNLNGALFLMLAQMTFGFVFAVITAFPEEFPVFLREHHDGMYRVSIYYTSKMLAELPQFIIIPAVFTAIMYWLVGLNPTAEAFFINMGIMIIVCNCSVSFGYMLSSLSSNVTVVLAAAPVFIVPAMAVGGFYIKDDTIPDYLAWFKYLSWFKYANENAVYNQWKDITNISCSQLAGGLSGCLSSGDDVIQSLSYSGDNVIFNYMMMLVLLFGLRIVGFIVIFIRSRRRYTIGKAKGSG